MIVTVQPAVGQEGGFVSKKRRYFAQQRCWDLSRFHSDLGSCLEPDGLVWGHDPDEWTRRVIAACARIEAEPNQVHARGIGAGAWVYDLVWTLGDPHQPQFHDIALALDCVWPWAAQDRKQWETVVCERLNHLYASSAQLKVLVTSTPTFTQVDEGRGLARDLTAASWERYCGLRSELLVSLFSQPAPDFRHCSLSGIWFPELCTTPAGFGPLEYT
jgi:hypothetical protein